MTLDGVMQGPGSAEEDPSGGFIYGGWVAPYWDEVGDKLMEKQLEPADLLLGRKTFDIWEHYWPARADQWKGINEVTKYVLSATRTTSDWNNTVFLHSVADIIKLKATEGSAIKVWGSAELTQLLMKHDLVDELWLKIYPISLGQGKKLFDHGMPAGAFQLTESAITPRGVVFVNYQRTGAVQTGTMGA